MGAALPLRGAAGLLVAVCLLLAGQPAEAQDGLPQEYVMVPEEAGEASLRAHLEALGVPDIQVDTECTGQGDEQRCRPIVSDQAGNRLAEFAVGDELAVLAHGRYPNRAAALIEHTSGQGLLARSETFVIDQSGRRSPAPRPEGSALGSGARLLLPNDALVAVERERIAVYSPGGGLQAQVALPLGAAHAVATADLRGNVAVAAVAEGTDELLACTLAGCAVLDLALAEHGDRLGVLAAFPRDAESAYVAVYRYVNPYNKGLYLGWANVRTGERNIVPLVNSAIRNVGFSPELYLDGGQIVIGARDSTHGRPVRYRVTHEQLASAYPPAMPHTDEYDQEELFSIILGWGVTSFNWYISSVVEKNDQTYAQVSYDLSDALANAFQFEGRIGDTRLAMTYVRQKLTREGGADLETLNLLYNVDDLFAPQWGLRVIRESGRIGGTATYEDTGGAPFSTPQRTSTRFSAPFSRLRADVTIERGFYFGLEYQDTNLPSAVGFSDYNGTLLATRYDEHLELRGLLLNLGYDHAQYLHRYETEHNGLFYSGRLGFGRASLDLSGAVEAEVLSTTGKTTVKTFDIDVFALDGEFGYAYLKRVRSLRGAGFLVVLGYRAGYASYTATRDPPTDAPPSESGTLYPEFDRTDLSHGAFARLLLIF